MSLYLRHKIWWSRIQRDNVKLDRSTKCHSKAEAIKVEARWLAQLSDAGEDLTVLQKTKPLTLQQLYDRFEQFAKGGGVAAERTKAFYKDAAKPLFDDLGDTPITAITTSKIEEWAVKRATTVSPPRKKPVGPARVNASLRTLRRMLKLAERWELLRKCPKISLLQGERSREFVITDEILSLMLVHEKCTPLLTNLIPFLIDTGLRLGEALALDWVRVGLEPKPGAELGWVYIDKGKSKYAKRHVPLTQRAHDTLEAIYKEQRGRAFYVFTRKHNSRLHLSRHWVSEQFRELRDVLGLPQDCVIHSCRHTFCTRLGESGASAFDIQRLAGHGSITMSQRYTHPTPKHLERAIATMEKAFAAQENREEITPEVVAKIAAETKKENK